MPELPAALQQVIDRQEIRDLFARYCRGIDRLDGGLVRSVYHPDSFDDHGSYKGSGPAFADHVIPALSRFTSTTHFLGNSLIEFDGADVARCETYCLAFHRSHADGVDTDHLVAVRYVDRVERRGGGPWLIAHRVVVFDWARSDPAGERWAFLPEYVLGHRGDGMDLALSR